MIAERVETLIVGAGPVGLFLAAELRRRGRQCVVAERSSGPSRHSKALAIMPGTMEMFERAGIADAFSQRANRIDRVRFTTPRRSTLIAFGAIRSKYNFVSILPQCTTEELLAAHLRALGGEIRYRSEVLSFSQNGDTVEALIETPGGPYSIAARYLIGCDGVRSAVREQAGIAFRGGTYPGTMLLADLHVNSDVPVNEARVHLHQDGVVTLFPMSEHLRRVVLVSPRADLPDDLNVDALQERLSAAGYNGTLIEDIVWSSAFRVHRRIASAMRRGNVFLAGDSAHTHSPVGGQGMNVGLRDAWSLAEKLEPVLAGRAPQMLLERYEAERLPVARGVLRRTHVLTRALVDPHPMMRLARERIVPVLAGLPMVHRPVLRSLAQLHTIARA